MLRLDRITKSFDEHRVLDDVSFSVPDGSLTGFVGGNGAGKTTTMRVVMGLLTADSGTVTRDGVPLTAQDRQRFGYMPEERGLYPKQEIIDQLVYFGTLHGASRAAATARARELLERFGLAERAADKLETLSLGNQQRVQIAVALMHEPTALVLDEPFSGLDPDAVNAMAELIRGCADTGVPVLFSSHQLDLVERLCDRIVILARGQVVAEGTAEELRAAHQRLVRIDAPGVATWIRRIDGIALVDVAADSAVFNPFSPDAGRRVLQAALEHGDVTTFGDVRIPLSELYQEATR